ncbi:MULTISPECIES: hypothetical protein [Vibrio]|uniref:Uncharacterized protein n=2 Tax=Vibrio TaxID=662 RepID=A0A2N7NFD1_9VIBR|nr:hypothetical protein [Vibrio tasmaniensis]PMP11894.1 hypothetical protein BCS92_19310 [Vibrio tasmaniensis]TKG28884.1 hypothetical protein FC057_20490 [Vibrio tasmaniensis]TKG41097.1 hypothetical protein FC063_08425 [Vibrio tasmaniensis]TKG43766.1 hypothetical protein FC060_18840 [Vibrio tasmaniensis]TKG48767.1 hypothetical protein FC061_14695 [Vibrio tasmaniensis]
MSYWFGIGSSKVELVGSFETLEQAQRAYESEPEATVGIFNASTESYALIMLEKLKPKPIVSSLPLRMRQAYLLGKRGGKNPYALGSQEFNDFERARDK